MSTSRDFRINVATVQAVMENNSDSDESSEETEENDTTTADQEMEEVYSCTWFITVNEKIWRTTGTNFSACGATPLSTKINSATTICHICSFFKT